jgi:hypothetical protein
MSKARRRAGGSLVKESVTDLDTAIAPAIANQDPPSDQIAAALVVITIIIGIATVGVWTEKAEPAPAKSASAKGESATVKAAATCVKAASSPVESATSVPAASTASECPGR